MSNQWRPPVPTDAELLARIAAGHVVWRSAKGEQYAVDLHTFNRCTQQVRRLQRERLVKPEPAPDKPMDLTDTGVRVLLHAWRSEGEAA